ncbi:AAA family ATPase [Vibrio marisflavi]|uniref:ATP/GTP phosphatase n=1 Tax=Vibrio marisflavi CECT 7928 TaxID=634439 RepID=A0ABM9A5D8_9VIBR|nr:ATP-binding protein [Vibrio marisflavi]CAH0539807.1 ATP/GTP phosphatase [Vibrio marisflavi CECT 7928]
MIESIYLDNYKKFVDFELNNLKTINVISGSNNTGKTSILEALFFLCDRLSPDNMLRQYTIRNVKSYTINSQGQMWQMIFNDYDLTKKITIKITDSNGNEEVATYNHLDKANNEIISIQNQSVNSSNIVSTSSADISSLHSEFEINKKKCGDTYFYIRDNKLALSHKDLKLSDLTKVAIFVNSTSNATNKEDMDRLGKLIVNRRIEDIIASLQIIEPKLKSINIIPEANMPTVYCDTGLSRQYPLYHMGEGISKFLSILISICSVQNGLVCIDELENGIHYSLFPKVWGIIDKLAKDNNNQIFVTTHNHDLLKGLNTFCQESKDSSVEFIRIDETKSGLVAKNYDSEMLSAAMDRQWEIR